MPEHLENACESNKFWSTSEIEEENPDDLFSLENWRPTTINEEFYEFEGNLVSSYDHENGGDVVYVAVGKGYTSMDALMWTVKNAVKPSTLINLIHIYPEVKVETILIESDQVAKAILEIILILNIKNLVLGTTKPNLRKLRKGGGIAEEILKNAGDTCEVKIIFQGKEVIAEIGMSPSQSPSPSSKHQQDSDDDTLKSIQQGRGLTGEDSAFSCGCFARKST
ncbi:hypothetical protein GIB67_001047 [Kingdonia uniflora]|uniref:Uncharacterized protein n=1 Tax=Kingdonia uniflora TaxID=39325 RepID=A0A7J7MGD1_9MAGN|nr:hypothetical protein GIB67_001047 [Kingdonia uniflora]